MSITEGIPIPESFTANPSAAVTTPATRPAAAAG
jgi:hypothetical protein